MRRLQHPCVVKVHCLLDSPMMVDGPSAGGGAGGRDRGEGRFRIVMENMAGGSVARFVKHIGALPRGVAARYTAAALSGLGHLHGHGIVHADIKPSNLLLTPEGVCKLADFGLARRAAECAQFSATVQLDDDSDGGIEGTLPYMSPLLLIRAAYSPQSDLWALGCTVVEVVTGQVPWMDR
eukprot:gene5193-13501_t